MNQKEQGGASPMRGPALLFMRRYLIGDAHSFCREQLPDRVGVCGDLRLQALQRVEPNLVPQVPAKFQPDGLPVQISSKSNK